MKVVVLSITGALLATVWWLVAGHTVRSAQTTVQPQPAPVFSIQRHGDDDDELFGGGSTSFDSGISAPVMRSSGS